MRRTALLAVVLALLLTAPAFAFTDTSEDLELERAAHFLYINGIMLGYDSGTFGTYDAITYRQVALVSERLGLGEFAAAINGAEVPMREVYAPAYRGVVQEMFPDLGWLEDRGDEGLTRGQFARLLYRYLQ